MQIYANIYIQLALNIHGFYTQGFNKQQSKNIQKKVSPKLNM